MQGGGGGEPISWGASLQAPVWSLRRPHGIQEVTVAGFCSCCWWKTGQETWVSTRGGRVPGFRLGMGKMVIPVTVLYPY